MAPVFANSKHECRVLIEKLTVVQLAKKFPNFCGTLRSISVFKRDRHWSLS